MIASATVSGHDEASNLFFDDGTAVNIVGGDEDVTDNACNDAAGDSCWG